MSQKCFKCAQDTPWVTLNCNCVQIRDSDNIDLDFKDGGGVEEEKHEKDGVKVTNCCCLQWRRKNKRGMTGKRSIEKQSNW